MVNQGSPGLKQHTALLVREDRPDHETGHAVGHIAAMAVEAVLGTVQPGDLTVRPVKVQQVEDGAQHRVDGRKLHHAAGHPARVGFVIEIKRPGIPWRDPVLLHTGFGKHQGLAGFGDFHLPQHGPHGFGITAGGKGELSALQLGIKVSARIGQGGAPVVVRGFLVGNRLGGRGSCHESLARQNEQQQGMRTMRNHTEDK